jgi:serine phosphatase RsbU (regulator of sigma subunit)
MPARPRARYFPGVVVQADRRVRGISVDGLAFLARAIAAAAQRSTLADALADVANAARVVARADLVLVRIPVADRLEAVAVAGQPALAAELEGTHLPAAELPRAILTTLADAPGPVRHAASRAAADSVLLVPIRGAGTTGSLEAYRAGADFSEGERLAAELAASHAALVLRAFAAGEGGTSDVLESSLLDLVGESLAAASDGLETASAISRVAAHLVGARAGLLWEQEYGWLVLAGSYGLDTESDLGTARELAAVALEEAVSVRSVSSGELPANCGVATALALGQPALGVLQLLFPPGGEPGPAQLSTLTTFGVRAAHALRSGSRTRALEVELERERAVLAVVGQATSELSLAHTLETAVDRVAELLDVDRVALYLRTEEDALIPAAARELGGPHAQVAGRLLELALASPWGHATVDSEDVTSDERLRDVHEAGSESGIAAALAAALLVRDEVIGLLAVYPSQGRGTAENDARLLAELARQLAVAVQNAQLHERTSELSLQREAALASERESSRRMRALYEISRSFAQSLSLEATLDALARTVVDVLDVDAALISLPDGRRELLMPRALHVKDQQLEDAARAILFRPQPFGAAPVQRLFRRAEPFRLERGHEILEPFLARGWTGAVVPVATPAETIAALTILSFRPGSPIGEETIDSGVAIAGQAALAIDNARLYQQLKEFSDTMQRSLLPREAPAVAGLEVGEVYESSARVDVGGDVYDFLELDDGRLAVVLGDVTGHGVEATADMAMAKFVFRSLAREHPEPGDFLSFANDVVVDEIAPGKFITMTYVAIDPGRGAVACANAGHPPPRLVLPDGTVGGLDASGVVLGIDSGQEYREVHADLPVGATIVLYTDGVIEARRDGELYGTERLDALLVRRRQLPARELAHAVTEDARRYSGGELSDDLAVVVIRRVS